MEKQKIGSGVHFYFIFTGDRGAVLRGEECGVRECRALHSGSTAPESEPSLLATHGSRLHRPLTVHCSLFTVQCSPARLERVSSRPACRFW
eukprot:233260-Rhodomonas_salina.2